ncbi:MAG: hypothetical protein NVS2B14_17560 [Chamaesiphon sp.]
MISWIKNREIYLEHQDAEFLPDDGWQEKVRDAGLKLLSPRQWYWQQNIKDPSLNFEIASRHISALLNILNNKKKRHRVMNSKK